MRFKVTYYTAGDQLVTKIVEAEDENKALCLLENDEQEPLSVPVLVQILEEE